MINLSRDDLELTLSEVKSNLLQTYIQFIGLEAMKQDLENRLSKMPKPKKAKDKENTTDVANHYVG